MIDFPKPRNAKHMMQFLGLTGVYRDYIKDYALLEAPLRKLTHKTSFWNGVMSLEEEEAFKKLKEAMVSSSILHHPDFNKDFFVFSDASAIGAGAVLCQKFEETFFPVSYASWIFSLTECNYSTTERELLALVKAVKKWKGYFLNRKFFAKTDHKALTGIIHLKDPHGRIARWMMELNEFHFKLEFIPGKQNILPDALSHAHDEVVGAIADAMADSLKTHTVIHILNT